MLIHGDPSHVTLNKGSQEGLYHGLNMLVTRNGTEVGRIRVSTVEPDEADATVTDQGLGINTQDLATAIYQLPAISSAPGGDTQVGPTNHNVDSSTTGSGSARSFFSGPLGAILAGALGVGTRSRSAAGHGSGGSSGGNAVGNGQASVGPAALTFNGLTGITPRLRTPSTRPPSSRRHPDHLRPRQHQRRRLTFEYHVYRDPSPTVLQNPDQLPDPHGDRPPRSASCRSSPRPSSPYVMTASRTSARSSSSKPDPTNNTNTPIKGDFFRRPTSRRPPSSSPSPTPAC